MSLNPFLKAMIDYSNREVAAIYAFAGDDDEAHEIGREAANFVRAGLALTPPAVGAVAAIAADIWADNPEGMRPFLDNLRAVLAALDQ